MTSCNSSSAPLIAHSKTCSPAQSFSIWFT